MPWAELSDTVASVPALQGVGFSAEVRPVASAGLVPRLWLDKDRARLNLENGFWVWMTLGSLQLSVRFSLLAVVGNRAVFEAVEALPVDDPAAHHHDHRWLVAAPKPSFEGWTSEPLSCPHCGERLEDFTTIADSRRQLACCSLACREAGRVFRWPPLPPELIGIAEAPPAAASTDKAQQHAEASHATQEVV